MSFESRLGKLRTIWPPEQTELPPWMEDRIYQAAQEPAEIAVKRQAWARAQRRRRAEGRPHPREDECHEATWYELDELKAFIEREGGDVEAALAQWYAAAEHWPTLLGWPNDMSELTRDIAYFTPYQAERRAGLASEGYQRELDAAMAERQEGGQA